MMYEFYHVTNSRLYQFSPFYDKCKIIMKREGQLRSRFTFEGNLTFVGADFDYIINFWQTNNIDSFDIEMTKNGLFYTYLRIPIKGQFDYNIKKAEFKVNLLDQYTQYDIDFEKTVNIYNYRSKQPTNLQYNGFLVREVLDTLYTPFMDGTLPVTQDMLISVISDIKKYTVSNATAYNLSLKKMNEMMLGLFNADFYINDYNKLAVSRNYLPESPLGYNLPIINFGNFYGIDWLKTQNTKEYDNTKYIRKVSLSTMYFDQNENTSWKTEFATQEIIFNGVDINNPTKEITLSEVCNEVNLLRISLNNDVVPNTGFAFSNCVFNGNTLKFDVEYDTYGTYNKELSNLMLISNHQLIAPNMDKEIIAPAFGNIFDLKVHKEICCLKEWYDNDGYRNSDDYLFKEIQEPLNGGFWTYKIYKA